ncbi:MAG: tetratricopeptide repeat protein, partial [Planctomycetota bacterium]
MNDRGEVWFDGEGVDRRGGSPRGLSYALVWVGLFLACFLLIWRCHRDVTYLPPYEDQAVGLWTEADFLAETGFDYRRLRYGERHFMHPEPGVRSYMISLLPTAVALLMRACPDVKTSFFVAHLVSFAFAAASVVIVMAAVQPRAGWMGAVLLGAALASTPLFSAQTEMLGMDLPMTAFALLTAVLLARRRYLAAGIFSSLAFAMKVTGGILTALTLAVVVRDLWRRCPDDFPSRGRSLLIVAFLAGLLGLETWLVAWGDTSLEIRRLIHWPEAFQLPRAMMWFPEVSLLAILLAIGTLAFVFREKRASTRSETAEPTRRGREDGERLLWISWLLVLAFLATSLPYILIPRYATCPAAFLFVIAGLLWFPPNRLRWLSHAGFLCLAVFNVLNADGRFYPRPESLAADVFAEDPGLFARSCPITERSREYLGDLRGTLAAMRQLEALGKDVPVFLPLPYMFYATKPRLGYVTSPLRVVDTNRFSSAIDGFANLMRSPDALKSVVFVWAGRARAFVPLPNVGNEILFDDQSDPPLIIYRLTTSDLPKDRRAIEDWYLDRTWGKEWSLRRASDRADFLELTARQERAIREMKEALAWDLSDTPARCRLLERLAALEHGDVRAGGETSLLADGTDYQDLLNRSRRMARSFDKKEDPALFDDRLAMLQSAIDLYLQGNRIDARHRLIEQAEGGVPGVRELAEIILGDMELEAGNLAEAARRYKNALNLDDALPEAHDRLGLVYL